jgi:hypothetical protein
MQQEDVHLYLLFQVSLVDDKPDVGGRLQTYYTLNPPFVNATHLTIIITQHQRHHADDAVGFVEVKVHGYDSGKRIIKYYGASQC